MTAIGTMRRAGDRFSKSKKAALNQAERNRQGVEGFLKTTVLPDKIAAFIKSASQASRENKAVVPRELERAFRAACARMPDALYTFVMKRVRFAD